MNLDIRAHLQHRLSVSLVGTTYCRTCDLYLTELHTVSIELDPASRSTDVVVQATIGDQR